VSADPITRLNAALGGRYRIERKLGEGGMARVYLAEDTKHERSVALKVLKPEYAEAVGADRFLAEIKTTANLQHPNILPLHDSGETDGILYYVMPYVAGESLRDRLDREKQLPVAEAVRIATSVADALDYAHRQGVIHRDVKPANVLMVDGNPVVADFGIARVSGTLGAPDGATEMGVAIGTPYYMSPEQATGDGIVGPRSDLYSLACVLYEMLTGEPPYQGATIHAVLGKIIAGKPISVTDERRTVPRNVDAAIRCALEAIPADRFSRLSEFKEALANPAFRYRDTREAATEARLWKRVALGATALLLLAIGGLVLEWRPSGASPTPLARYRLTFEEGQAPTPDEFSSMTLAMSPDGSRLAYVRVHEDGTRRIWLRPRDDEASIPVPGTEGARVPFFSPDGSKLGFVASRPRFGIRWVPVEGGPPLTLVGGASDGAGASWGPDGYVYYISVYDNNSLRRIASTRESATEVVLEASGEVRFGAPEALPGGRGLLVSIDRSGESADSVGVLDLRSGQLRGLVRGVRGMYLTAGYLVFATTDGDLMGAPFDERALTITGLVVPLLSDLAPPTGRRAAIALAGSGRLVYSREFDAGDELIWVDRSGRVSPFEPTWSPELLRIGWAQLAPGDGRVAISGRLPNGEERVSIKVLGGTSFPLPSVRGPVSWSLDGSRIISTADTSGGASWDLWSTPIDGTGFPELLVDHVRGIVEGFPEPPDGEWLFFRTGYQPTTPDFYRAQPGGSPQPLLVHDSIGYATPSLSPDGRYLAYLTNESGPRFDRRGSRALHVRSYPGIGPVVWTAEGYQPHWSSDGRELYFVRPPTEGADGATEPPQMVSLRVDTSAGFRVIDETDLFPLPEGVVWESIFYTYYDVTEDGERFLMFRPRASEAEGPTYHVVDGLEALIRRRLGG